MPVGRVTSVQSFVTGCLLQLPERVRVTFCYTELDEIQKTESKGVHLTTAGSPLTPSHAGTCRGDRPPGFSAGRL